MSLQVDSREGLDVTGNGWCSLEAVQGFFIHGLDRQANLTT